jgi:large exoprotein involved in heme utilization and adhesion
LDTLTVSNNSAVSASTQTGEAGSLRINANSNPASSVQLSNKSRLSVEATAGGTAGNLTIKAGQVSVQDGGAITVISPKGQAGNLNITAHSLFLNRGTLSAETGKSSAQSGANITLKGLELLRLENESLISARALDAASGGNINIDTTFLIALPPVGPNGSDIIASAQQGSGGKIDINAAGIFGIEERRAIPGNRTNDIDASSEFGSAGQVTLSTLINPSQGLSQLPTQLVDPTRQIDSSCAARGDNESKFTVTGRGGLPSTPSDLLTPELVLDDFGTLATANPPVSEPVEPASSSPHKQLVEAQGWIIAADGTVVLTALAPSVTPHSGPLTPASCQHTQK